MCVSAVTCNSTETPSHEHFLEFEMSICLSHIPFLSAPGLEEYLLQSNTNNCWPITYTFVQRNEQLFYMATV